MIRIDAKDDITSLNSTTLSEQNFREDDLREWILQDSRTILGEDVLLLGREVPVKGLRDAIDLLAIDREGHLIVIELKQGRIGGDVDFQALKYAAYTASWDFGHLQDQFKKFTSTRWGQRLHDKGRSFEEVLDAFCNNDATLNQDQRIMLVGESLGERLDLVARWLSNRDIDVTVIEAQLYKDDERLYLHANRTIPVPEQTVPNLNPDTSKEPWKNDGQQWHLNKLTNDDTAELLNETVGALADIEFLEEPDWGKKSYISIEQNRKRRIAVVTNKTSFHIQILDVPVDAVDTESLASTLNLPTKNVNAEEDIRGGRSGVRITCRTNEQLNTTALTEETRRLLAEENNRP